MWDTRLWPVWSIQSILILQLHSPLLISARLISPITILITGIIMVWLDMSIQHCGSFLSPSLHSILPLLLSFFLWNVPCIIFLTILCLYLFHFLETQMLFSTVTAHFYHSMQAFSFLQNLVIYFKKTLILTNVVYYIIWWIEFSSLLKISDTGYFPHNLSAYVNCISINITFKSIKFSIYPTTIGLTFLYKVHINLFSCIYIHIYIYFCSVAYFFHFIDYLLRISHVFDIVYFALSVTLFLLLKEMDYQFD